MATKVREAIAAVQAAGWYQVRQRGSHRQFKHATLPGDVTIAGHPNETLRPGTWNNIQKQAGLK